MNCRVPRIGEHVGTKAHFNIIHNVLGLPPLSSEDSLSDYGVYLSTADMGLKCFSCHSQPVDDIISHPALH